MRVIRIEAFVANRCFGHALQNELTSIKAINHQRIFNEKLAMTRRSKVEGMSCLIRGFL